jgi:quinol monooxygenase YgiN
VIIVGGVLDVEPDEREDFLAGRHEMMRRSRAEDGCLEYIFSADPIDPRRVVLFERWASQETLDAHIAKIRANPSPPTGPAPKTVSLTTYYVSDERPLGG